MIEDLFVVKGPIVRSEILCYCPEEIKIDLLCVKKCIVSTRLL